MDNAMLNVLGVNGAAGILGMNNVSSAISPDGNSGISFGTVLQAAVAGSDTNTMTSGVADLLQTNENAQLIMPTLTFEQKLDNLLTKAEELDPEIAEAVKKILLAAVNVNAENGSSVKTVVVSDILAGLTGSEKAEVKSVAADIIDLIKSGLESDSSDILTALGAVFEKLTGKENQDDDQDSDEEAASDNAAEMLAAMVQSFCGNNEAVQTVDTMVKGNAEVPEIVSYLEKNELSDQIVQQFAQTAEKYLSSDDKKMPFELLSGKADTLQSSAAVPIAVKAVVVSSELNQLLNSDSGSNSSNGETEDLSAMFAQNLQNVTSVTTEPVQTEAPFTSISSQIVDQLSAKLSQSSLSGGVSELKILLNPENLGEVAVKLVSENGSVSVMLSAANSSVAKMLSDNLPALTSALTNQNVTIKDITIIDPSQAGSQMGFNFTNQNSGSERDSSAGGDRRVNGVFSLNPDEIETDTTAVQNETQEKILKGAKLWATA